jgi:hypothetical protein
MTWYSITTRSYCAGLAVAAGRVHTAAPILAWSVGLEWSVVQERLRQVRATVEPLSETPLIASFQGQWAFLSNYHLVPHGVQCPTVGKRAPGGVALPGDVPALLPTVEHAYQAAKVSGLANFLAMVQLTLGQYRANTPGQAKRLGQRITLRPDWEDVKIGIMRDLLGQKFAPGTALVAALIATGNAWLSEGNTWHDQFWGQCQCARCQGRGGNWLGRLLMQTRWARQDGAT